MKHKMLTIVTSIGLIYIFLIALMFFMQRDMMYFTNAEKPSLKQTGITDLTEISIKTEDNFTLFGWYKAPDTPQKPTIVWFHGNASNVSITAARAAPYLQKGYGLLAVEYRGYSGNPGSPTEQGLYEDARAFIGWLKENGTPENNIIVYGESIGTGPAVQIATEHSALHTLILESPFTSTVDAATFHYPYVPVKWLVKDRYENLSKIKNIKAPLIVVYGNKDRVIPHYLGEKLFNAAPQPKSLVVIEGGDHNDLDNYNVADKIISLLSE
jgi:fermentation-respiration switch protein FrsA (DUF1100 family)